MQDEQLRNRLFEHLWRGGQYAFYWITPGRKSFWFEVGCIPKSLRPIEKNIFFGVHPTTAIPETNARGQPTEPLYVRSQTAYVAAINCLYAELDGDKETALFTARTVTPSPSVIIDSGGGYHLYWLFDKPMLLIDDDTREYARRLQWRWVKHITGADQGAKDLCRVLRVPGSRNYKPKYAPDFPRVEFVRWLDVTYALQELIMRLPLEPQRSTRSYASRATDGTEGDKVLRTAERMIGRAPDGAKHDELLKAARLVGGAVVNGWLSESDAEQALEKAIREKANVDSVSSALTTIAVGIGYGKEIPL